MVTKRKSARRAAPRRRVYAARRAAPRRRAKSGVTMIPSAMATAALVAVNVKHGKNLITSVTNYGKADVQTMGKRVMEGITGANPWVRETMVAFVKPSNLIVDAAAVAAGSLAGEAVKKFAPGVIKRPLGKIAKKVPKVI